MAVKVLVAVLDWGLGHASRSIPVIELLTANGVTVVLASSGTALTFLQYRFTHLQTEVMPSVNVRYGKQGAAYGLAVRTLAQPWINAKQHRWVKNLVKQNDIDGIISDNVYGAWHENIPSAIITHQLNLNAPYAKGFANWALTKWLRRFDSIWIPDSRGEGSISGSLSANRNIDLNIEWLGILSRFNGARDSVKSAAVEKKYHYTALLSGPEPQRSLLEEELLQLFAGLEGKKIIVQGKPEYQGVSEQETNGVMTIPFLDGDALAELLQDSEVVICRSGYSSICDLVALGCSAILVPTPQQPEQLYLAGHCAAKGWFAMALQSALTKNDVLKKRTSYYNYPNSSRVEEVALKFIGNL